MKGRPYLALVFSMIFWSFSFVWFKIANEDYDPIAIVFIRLCIAIVFLSAFLWITGRFIRVKKGDRKYFFLLALFEPFLYFLGESFGLTYVSSTVGSVIISTIPVFAVIFAWIIYRERLKLINYLGVIVSFAGVLIFITNSTGSIDMNPKGLALMFLAVISAVGYNMVLHKLTHKYDPVTIVNMQNIIGAILFLPLFLIFDLREVMATGIVAGSFGSIVLLAIFASCGAFVLFAYSVKYLGVARANIFSNLIPLFTAIFAWFVVSERLTVRNGIGMAVVIAGLFLSQAGKNRKAVVDTDFAGRSA
jgi:drug/metabolite transporter (DMT)-like permease